MKRSVIFVVLTYLASMTTNGFADVATYVFERGAEAWCQNH